MRGFRGGGGFEGEEGKAEVLVDFVLMMKFVFARNLQSLWTFTMARRCTRRRWDCSNSESLSFSRRTGRDESSRLGEDESDLEDKLRPSIHYLQKLGPEHLPQIFESARWVFDSDADMGFDVSLPPVQFLRTQETES